MIGKTVFLAAFVAIAQIAAASPPGCLLGAVNTAKDQSNMKEVCANKDMPGAIKKLCGDATDDALSAFKDICKDAGVKVSVSATPTGSSSSGSSATGTASSDSSDSSASGSAASGTAAGTGTGVLYPTNGANSTGIVTVKPTGSSPSGGPAGSGTASGGLPEHTGAAGKMDVAGVLALVAGLAAVGL